MTTHHYTACSQSAPTAVSPQPWGSPCALRRETVQRILVIKLRHFGDVLVYNGTEAIWQVIGMCTWRIPWTVTSSTNALRPNIVVSGRCGTACLLAIMIW